MRRSVARSGNHIEVVASEQVETAFLRSTQRRGQGDQLRCGSHPVACLNVDAVERTRLHTVFVAGLHNHIVDLAILGESADIRSGKIGANGLDDGLWRYALALASRHIDGERVLREVVGIRGHRNGHLRTFIQFSRELVGIINKGGVVVARTVLEVQLNGRT